MVENNSLQIMVIEYTSTINLLESYSVVLCLSSRKPTLINNL